MTLLKKWRILLLSFAPRTSIVLMSAFLAGVAVHSFFPLRRMSIAHWSAFAAIMIIVIGRERMAASGSAAKIVKRKIVVALLALAVGLWWFDVKIPTAEVPVVTTHTGTVTDFEYGKFGKQAIVDSDGVMIQISTTNSLKIGSVVRFDCNLRPVEQKDGELVRQLVSRLRKSQASCSAKELDLVSLPPWWDVRQQFADLRQWSNLRLKSILPGDEGALIAGMLYGERGMSQASNDLFRQAGLTHLIAVSGSNITIVASIIFAVFLGIGLLRRKAFWATSITLLAYVTFTGFSASVARAAVMGWLVLLAHHTGRLPRTWHVLLVSAFVLCLLDPYMLAFDAGFALSFLATIGLMSWSPIFQDVFGFLPKFAGTQEAAATTASATVMTLPYMAFAFGRLSLAGLLTNVMAVPLVPWAMLFGAVALVWGKLSGWAIVSMPALGVSKTIFLSAKLANLMPWLAMDVLGMDLWLMAATYLALFIIWYRLRDKNRFSTNMAPLLSGCDDKRAKNVFIDRVSY